MNQSKHSGTVDTLKLPEDFDGLTEACRIALLALQQIAVSKGSWGQRTARSALRQIKAWL